MMERLRLTKYAQTKAKNLSLGNSQRLGMAKALLHRPEILILDEPVNGLDPAGMVEIRELLHDLALNHGVTVLISSHLLSEVAKIATHIGIIHEGELIQEIPSRQLKKLLYPRLTVNTRHNKAALAALNSAGYTFIVNEEGLLETADEKALRNPDEISRLLVYEGFPLAFIVLVLVFSQMVAALGYGDYFPWSIPAFYAVWRGRGFPWMRPAS